MKTYTFVVYTKGPDRSQDSITSSVIRTEHLAHLDKIAADGLPDIAGAFHDDGNWPGLMIFNSADTSMVKSLVESDPAVKAGRHSYELHSVFYSGISIKMIVKPLYI